MRFYNLTIFALLGLLSKDQVFGFIHIKHHHHHSHLAQGRPSNVTVSAPVPPPRSIVENNADIAAAKDTIKELKEEKNKLLTKSEDQKDAEFKANLKKLESSADRQKRAKEAEKLERTLEKDPKDKVAADKLAGLKKQIEKDQKDIAAELEAEKRENDALNSVN
jgi:hypothetical protein